MTSQYIFLNTLVFRAVYVYLWGVYILGLFCECCFSEFLYKLIWPVPPAAMDSPELFVFTNFHRNTDFDDVEILFIWMNQ